MTFYVIAQDLGEDLKVMCLDKIKMFGVSATLPALFITEDAALNVLYEIQKANPLLKQYTVWPVTMALTPVVKEHACPTSTLI